MSPQPSYEVLAAEVRRLGGLVEELTAENAELRRRLGQNPRNSSPPPPAEGLDKPAPRSRRTSSGRKPGGQPGHRGQTLERVENPDEARRHEPTSCTGCGAGRGGGAGFTGTAVHDAWAPYDSYTSVTHALWARMCSAG